MDLDHVLRKVREFISFFETANIRDFLVNLDKESFMLIGGIGAVLVIILLMKRMVRWATFIVSVCAIIGLLHYTIPERGKSMELPELVTLFLGGTFIVAASIYIIFIRTD